MMKLGPFRATGSIGGPVRVVGRVGSTLVIGDVDKLQD